MHKHSEPNDVTEQAEKAQESERKHGHNEQSETESTAQKSTENMAAEWVLQYLFVHLYNSYLYIVSV